MSRKSDHFLSEIFSKTVPLLAATLFVVSAAPAQTPFSQDSAYAYLRVIAEEIGARPMGSPSEREAMRFAVDKFREFGLTGAYVMPMREAVSYSLGSSTNTNSGIAVGILKGKTNRVIVIGGHIDSAGPDIAGANDDGSGSATVIELARILAGRSNESTIVFALFGGEEQGLRGSRYFVKHFDLMDQVVLMIQIDMTNGSDWLLPLVDADHQSSPEWLVRASFEEFRNLGYSGLSFPTHFYSILESAPGGGIGSDHQPFLEKGIPAIDFTSDVTDPIHTPQDNLENFIPSGLKRSGDLVYKLVERFDGGVPEEKTGNYFLIQFGPLLLFIPPPLLAAFLAAALIAGVFSLIELRKRRPTEEPRAKIPGLKLFLLMIIIQVPVWFSENLVGFLAGWRFPWVSQPEAYFVLGFLGGLTGIWISLQLSPTLALTGIAYRYALRSMVFLAVFAGIFAPISLKLAVYPASAMMLLALAYSLRQNALRLACWLLAAYPMFRLIFSEGFYLFARSIAQTPDEGSAGFFLHVFYILFFSLWSFPFLLAFGALLFDSPDSVSWLRYFRHPAAGVFTAGAFLACVFVLAMVPPYSKLWKQQISVQQTINMTTGKGIAEVSSADYLSGANITVAGKDTLIEGRATRARVAAFAASEYDWIKLRRSVETKKDSNTTFDIRLHLGLFARPYSLTVTYSGLSVMPENVATPFVWSPGLNSVSFRWYSFPDTSIFLPVSFTVSGTDSVREYIEATFTEQPIPIEVRKESATVIKRTRVERTDIVRAH